MYVGIVSVVSQALLFDFVEFPIRSFDNLLSQPHPHEVIVSILEKINIQTERERERDMSELKYAAILVYINILLSFKN